MAALLFAALLSIGNDSLSSGWLAHRHNDRDEMNTTKEVRGGGEIKWLKERYLTSVYLLTLSFCSLSSWSVDIGIHIHTYIHTLPTIASSLVLWNFCQKICLILSLT